MLYLVTVANAFASDRTDEFDLWHVQILIDAESPKAALLQATSLSRESDVGKRLGYLDKSKLHAVRNIDDEFFCDASLLSSLSAARLPQLWLVSRIRAINEEELRLLASHRNIQLSYGLIYVDEGKV